VITAAERKGDLNSEWYVITTNYGQWSFYPDELVTFPRRPDNSKRDWRTPPAHPEDQLKTPTPLDLAVGDLLNGRYGPDLPGATEADRERNAQRVTAVTYNRARPKIITVSTYSIEDGPLTTAFLPDEPVIYPRPERDRPTHSEPQLNIALEAYGPYLAPESTDDHLRLLYLVVHPNAGGRWPRWLSAPIPLGNNTFLAKPPRTKPAEQWPQYVGRTLYGRHPRDPAWGQQPIAYIEQSQLDAAQQAYADYQARYAEPVLAGSENQ
jgi:hypothetical protein